MHVSTMTSFLRRVLSVGLVVRGVRPEQTREEGGGGLEERYGGRMCVERVCWGRH